MDVIQNIHEALQHDDVTGMLQILTEANSAAHQLQNGPADPPAHPPVSGGFTPSEKDEIISEGLRHEAFGCLVELVKHPLIGADYVKQKAVYIIEALLHHVGLNFYNAHTDSIQYKEGTLEVIKTLCEKLTSDSATTIADVIDRDMKGQIDRNTPMTLAVKGNNLPLVKYFVENGIQVNKFSEQGDLLFESPILQAILANKLEIVKYLMQNGVRLAANIEVSDDVMYTHLASSIGQSIVQCVDNAEPNLRERLTGMLPDIFYAMITSSCMDNPLNPRDIFYFFQFHNKLCTNAFLNGEIEHVGDDWSDFPRDDIPLNQFIFGQALYWFSSPTEELCLNVLTMLRNKEKLPIDINAPVLTQADGLFRFYVENCDCNYLTPLQYALGEPDSGECLQYLLMSGVDTNGVGGMGIHPLHLINVLVSDRQTIKNYNVIKGNAKLVLDEICAANLQMLLRYGVDLESDMAELKSETGAPCRVSLLEYFARQCNLPMCKVLLTAGARRFDRKIAERKDLIDLKPCHASFPGDFFVFSFDQFFTRNETCSFIEQELKPLPSLQSLCRNAVRSQFSQNIKEKVRELQLSDVLTNYLNLEELTDLEGLLNEYIGTKIILPEPPHDLITVEYD